jgi:hypothetical protein
MFGRITGTFIVLIYVVAVGLIGLATYLTVDMYSGEKIGEKEGTIVKKYERAPYTTINMVGKVPVSQFHPRTYNLEIEVNGGGIDGISISQELYSSLVVGKRVVVECKVGRSSKRLYIMRIVRVVYAGGSYPPALLIIFPLIFHSK